MTDQELIGPIEIRVPPNPSRSRVLRLAASGMASLAGFTVDEIEDIKIAVSEVLIALIEHGEGQPIDLQFMVDDQLFSVSGRTAVDQFDTEDSDLILCRTVLAEVSGSHGIDVIENQAHIWAAVSHAMI